MINRRHFLQAAAMLPFTNLARAEDAPQKLLIGARILEVKGKAAKVFGITNAQNSSGLNVLYGKPFSVELTNGLAEETAIHWHGLTPPTALDGVPGLSAPALKAGETRRYTFDNKRVGTHWMHSHLGLQEQLLLAAPLIVRETEKSANDELEHVVMLHDFTFRDPAEILAELQGGGGGHAAHMNMSMDHSEMAMPGMPAMLSDVAYDAILANDRTLDDPEILDVEQGRSLRLRLINGASATNMWVDLVGLEAELIAVDGNVIRFQKVKRFPLAIAQRADLRITLPREAGAWPILFQSEGAALRGGLVLRVKNGVVEKLSDQGEPGAAIDLAFETSLIGAFDLPKWKLGLRKTIMLTGGDSGYDWGFNGKPSMMHDVLFRVKAGEQVELSMHNMTAMAHPMHLHGHYFKMVAVNDKKVEGPVRDTVLVPPGMMVTLRFNADNPGAWAFHCHHLYHMNSGMMAAMDYKA
ncbi:multicopper oxidase family protein [Aestuariivirga litoralis]|uniref:multicopper oxidase family protein n=1 Tax=Aestuariivirga litoralis TaxID=2650924 RepID=UPI0018C5D5B0|nr:multicopper oxidase family protein [Aestuariivirga litoralis]MBG1233355.1 multicopper oxidase family protein [Aestuariivirga litoralis]